jgi:5-enolpyruvylshikimate-3-phosphate synthase
VLGSRLPGLQILDPGCVAKTYPNFWKDWDRARSAPRQQMGSDPIS